MEAIKETLDEKAQRLYKEYQETLEEKRIQDIVAALPVHDLLSNTLHEVKIFELPILSPERRYVLGFVLNNKQHKIEYAIPESTMQVRRSMMIEEAKKKIVEYIMSQLHKILWA